MRGGRIACNRIIAAIGLLFVPLVVVAEGLRSPDQQIAVHVSVDDEGIPFYSVRYAGETIIDSARLGLKFRAGGDLARGFRLSPGERRADDSSWEQPWGERRIVRDHYEELLVRFESVQAPRLNFGIRFRAYNDGVGFRYEVPAQASAELTDIVDELTEFRLPADSTAYWQPGDHKDKYEVLYRATLLAEMRNAHTPVTVRLPSGVHVSLHEAALVDYSAFTLEPREAGILHTVLRPWSDGIRVRTVAPMRTPWRTIQISPDAKGLLNSDLILNLNEPNTLGDTSWVQPGKYVGIWWAMHLGLRTWHAGPIHGATTEAARRYIDFAAEHGFAGVLVEGWNVGWGEDEAFSYTQATPDFDLRTVADYSHATGVRLIGHHETFGDIPNYETQMGDAFDMYASLGVRQVKTGYVGAAGSLRRLDADGQTRREWHDGQYAVDHHLRVLQAAAQRRISINTHEPVKDTGLRRTYPNWLSREGSRGQEYAVWGETPNPPEHTVLLAYTRMLGGPMDFTPGLFNLHIRKGDAIRRVQTTLAKQLALYVVLYSPLQMVPDLPENYARYSDAFQFIADVPTDWEQSVALAGEVGDYVAFARQERGGRDWYVGAITDEEPRALQISLAFLDPEQDYVATVYRDGDAADWQDNPYDYRIEELVLNRKQFLELKLAAGGGAAIRFRPKPGE